MKRFKRTVPLFIPAIRQIMMAAALLPGLVGAAHAVADLPSANPLPPVSTTALPTLYLIGDSTVNNGTRGLQGWGTPIAKYFDGSRINVVNRARGGRSSRTFLTEGLWDRVLSEMKPGDFVLMQFGHNDGGSVTKERSRASLKGSGEETREVVDPATGKKEVVHTYGWYIRKYVTDARARGVLPIVLSPVPRNIWKDGPYPAHPTTTASGPQRWPAQNGRLSSTSMGSSQSNMRSSGRRK